jgi:hypothetical protein
VQSAAKGEVTIELGSQGVRQHDDTILAARAVTNDNLVALQIEVVDAQTAALGAAETGAVEQTGHQAKEASALNGVEDEADFFGRQDGGEAFGPAGVEGVKAGQVDAEDFLVEEEQGVEGLVLGAGGDVAGDGQVGEEEFDLGGAHGGGMTVDSVYMRTENEQENRLGERKDA